MKKQALLAAVSVALNFLGIQPSDAQTRKISTQEQRVISERLGAWLKDPLSAQYRWPAIQLGATESRPRLPYCFSVNAKNAYGGYVGFRTIVGIVTQSSGKIIGFEYTTGLNDESSVDTDRLCSVLGTPPR
ncbi:MAG: hypothetical protein GEU95_13560 [Rhizobiales bacterium]|nr:hypothetical protein [Hyphomicrobiales bacterium]